MTLDELAALFSKMSVVGTEAALKRAGEQIGKDAEAHAKAKLGTYQGEAGIFPAWAPLAASTIEEKIKSGYPTPSPLLREGDLRDSISYDVEASGLTITVTLGSDSEVAVYQELGTIDIPPRPFLGPTMFERGEIYAAVAGLEVVEAMGAIAGVPVLATNPLRGRP